MIELNIITRCSRQQNLLKIIETLFLKDFAIIWHIIFDINKIKEIDSNLLYTLSNINYIKIYYDKSDINSYGYNLINKIIKSIINENSFIYLLDDDNILHENFNILYKLINEKEIIIFNQFINYKDFTNSKYRYASIDNVKIGSIDAAQYIIKRNVFTLNNNHINYMNDYCADGILMELLLKLYPEKFLFINEILCYYNYLTEKKEFSLPKILLLGNNENNTQLLSNNDTNFECRELNVLNITQSYNINEILYEFKPNSIITIGNVNLTELNDLSYDFRKKWLHFDKIDKNTGHYSYYCANNFILDTHYKINPLISFFTPIYNTGNILYRTYESIKNQEYTNWEWVIVNDSNDNLTLNIAYEIAKKDCRVKVYDFREKTGGIIGESKYRAASLCNGIYLMELDHDDYITSDAALLMVKCFQENPDCKFVYSDCAEIDENHNSLTYGNGFAFGYGTYREEKYNNKIYQVINTPNINPKTIRHIVGVPNHFRAWDRFFYHSIGGHNRNLSIADDYELIVKTFLNTTMIKIPKLLYLQFYHNNNTQNLTRADIQRRVRSISEYYNEKIHDRFIELGVIDWAYNFNNEYPLCAESKFGDEEKYVNKIYKL